MPIRNHAQRVGSGIDFEPDVVDSSSCSMAKAPVIRATDLLSRPGLGVSLNEKMAAQHPYKPTNGPEYHFGDESVTDQ